MTTVKYENVWQAFAAAQAEFKTPAQSGYNPHFKSKYSTLGDIFAATLPALHKHGLAFTQLMRTREDGSVILDTVIVTPSIDGTIESSVIVPRGDNPQQFGSALSYMKRYAAAALFGVVDGMDDDGEIAATPTASKAKSQNGAQRPRNPATDEQKQAPKDSDAIRKQLHVEIGGTFPAIDIDNARHWLVEKYTSAKTPRNVRTSSADLTDEERLEIIEALKAKRQHYHDLWLQEAES